MQHNNNNQKTNWTNCIRCKYHRNRRYVVKGRSGFVDPGKHKQPNTPHTSPTVAGATVTALTPNFASPSNPPKLQQHYIIWKGEPLCENIPVNPDFLPAHITSHILFIPTSPSDYDTRTANIYSGEAGRLLHLAFAYCTTPFKYTISPFFQCPHKGDTPSPAEIYECLPHIHNIIQTATPDITGIILFNAAMQQNLFYSIPMAIAQAPTVIINMEYKLVPIRKISATIDKLNIPSPQKEPSCVVSD